MVFKDSGLKVLFLRALNHLLLGIFIALVLFALSSPASAVTYQYRMTYIGSNDLSFSSPIPYGDIYTDSSGYTPTALQAALTTTLGQTSLTSFGCYPPATGIALAFNSQLYTGTYCVFKFPTDATTFWRKVTISAIATGTMTGNILTGTGGTSTGGTEELPFDGLKAAAIFSFFFSFVMGTWFVTKNIGQILSAVKRW